MSKLPSVENFEFRNSEEWIKNSHESYVPLDEIRHRLRLRGSEWEETRKTFLETRKLQAVPLVLPSLSKTFWYFEADCIRQKLHAVEQQGIAVFGKIHDSGTFEKDFILNAAIEEAITSAIYEGANSTRARAKQLITEDRAPTSIDDQMLVNNHRAMAWIKENKTATLDLSLVLRLHEIVTLKTMTGDLVNYVGKFRDDVVYIGPHEGIDYRLIPQALEEAIAVCTSNKRFISPLVRGILLHYFVGYIHPFFDGNGRTARTLFYFQAIKNGLNFVELLSISAHLKEHGKRYERAFENAVKYEGDVTYFVDFSLDSLLYALNIVSSKVDYLRDIWKIRAKLSLNDQQIQLLQKLALNKFRKIYIETFAQQIQRTHEMARLELKKLVSVGLLEEGKQGKKLFYTINARRLRDEVELVGGKIPRKD